MAQISSIAKVSFPGIFILVDRQEKDAEGKNAIAEFEKKHKTKVYSVVTADDIFEYLSKTEINGELQVSEGATAAYKEYKKEYGV